MSTASVKPGDMATRVNRLAIVSIVLAALSLGSVVVGGIVVMAVFAVSAGHIALQQIRARGERGISLAYAALIVSYVMASYGVISSIYFAVALAEQT